MTDSAQQKVADSQELPPRYRAWAAERQVEHLREYAEHLCTKRRTRHAGRRILRWLDRGVSCFWEGP